MDAPIAIFGTGGQAREVVCLLHDLGQAAAIAALHEPDAVHEPRELMGVPVRPQSAFVPEQHLAVVAIGNPAVRQKVVGELPVTTKFQTLVHPKASVSQWVSLGAGTVVCAGAIMTCQVTVGAHCLVNMNVTVAHDCIIGRYCTLAPGANLSGNCKLGDRVDIGANAALRQSVAICSDVVIGMGGVVVKNIEATGVYVGVPVHRLRA